MTRRMSGLTLCLTILLAGPAANAEALLRPRVVVEGATVTLGDLFDNIGQKSSLPVMRAPAPGQRLNVDNDWLAHVALINGITWHPRGLFEDAVIERAGVVIGRERILASLQSALIERGAPTEFLVETDDHTPQMVIPVGVAAQLEIRDLFYDRDAKRFTASVAVPDQSSAHDAARIMISGRLVPTVAIPVLSRPINHGDMVNASDIAWIKLREADVRAAMVTDPGLMVGMTAKQNLRPNQPVSIADFQKPLAVTRGALVTMVLNHGGMALTAQGRSDDQGSLGDVIRVTNTHSNLTVEATIIGTNQVRVSLTGSVALAN
jgi:flagella basal body P-ring formation protein FlgA